MNPWTDAERHARRAHRYYESGRWGLALAELKLAIEKDPDQAEWYVGLGLTLEALGRFAEAADAFTIVTELRDDDKDAWVHRGVNTLRDNRPQEAIDALNHATTLDRNAVAPYSHRVLAYALLGEHEQAEVQFYFAINLAESPCPTAHDHIGHSLALRGRYAEAAEAWTRCLSIDPTYPDAQPCLARALWRNGQHDAAAHAFRRHLALEPDDTETLLDFARLEQVREQPDSALKLFQRATESDPGCPLAWQKLGDAYAEQDQPVQAQKAYDTSITLDPGRAGVRLGLAQLAAHQHDATQTINLLKQELACDGQSPREMVAVAELFYRFHEAGRAAGVITCLLADREANLEDDLVLACHLLRAKCAAQANQSGIMISDLRQITRLKPTHAKAWVHLAEAYAKDEQLDRAGAALRKALVLTADTDGSLTQLNRRIARQRLLARVRRVLPIPA